MFHFDENLLNFGACRRLPGCVPGASCNDPASFRPGSCSMGNAVNSPDRPKCHILVVDDEPMVSETVTLVLEVDGHTVETASNAKEALAIFAPGKFDIVITDFLMPGWTGDQLAAALKIRCTNQLVFMLTAFPEKVRRQVPLLMVDLLLAKPFDILEIRAAIHLFTSARAV